MGAQQTTASGGPSTREPRRPVVPQAPISLGLDRRAFEAAAMTQQYRAALRSEEEERRLAVLEEQEKTRKYQAWFASEVRRIEDEKTAEARRAQEDEKERLDRQFASIMSNIDAREDEKVRRAQVHGPAPPRSEEEKNVYRAATPRESRMMPSLFAADAESKREEEEGMRRQQLEDRKRIGAAVNSSADSAQGEYMDLMRQARQVWPSGLLSGSPQKLRDFSRDISSLAEKSRARYTEAAENDRASLPSVRAGNANAMAEMYAQYTTAASNSRLLGKLVEANDQLNILNGMTHRAERGDYSYSTKGTSFP